MNYNKLMAAALMMGLAAPAAFAEEEHEHEHFDISPSVSGGQIFSNGWSDDHSEFEPGERVFGYEIGEGFPSINDANGGFVNDPGINARVEEGWLQGTHGVPGIRIIGPLMQWVDETTGYQLADADTTLEFSFGASSVTATSTSGVLADIFIGSTHAHYNVIIGDTSGNRLDTITDPAVGIYQVEAVIINSLGGLTESESIFLNFNYWDDEEEHGHALEYTEEVLVPEPGSAFALLAGAGLLAIRRRRK